jgi:thiol-disulfide isomerase/thioredoxin
MLPSLARATTWINSRPLAAPERGGKVVVIDFWTYTCINWRRTVPYLRAWVERYGNAGLVLVGVHSPEFVFERNLDNVRQAVTDIGVAYPVAVDNDFAIWRTFDNHYWPALYIFDATGRLRHRVFGEDGPEDGYEGAETVIRKLLVEAGTGQGTLGPGAPVAPGRGAEAAADWAELRSGENYLGSARTENFVSPEGMVPGQAHRYTAPASLPLNGWALAGNFTVGTDRVVTAGAGGKIVYRFHARDVHLVMGPQTRGQLIRFRVLLDGRPPGRARGVDVDEDGFGTLREQRMYQLIRQPLPVETRLIEVEFSGPGAAAFSFTFG